MYRALTDELSPRSKSRALARQRHLLLCRSRPSDLSDAAASMCCSGLALRSFLPGAVETAIASCSAAPPSRRASRSSFVVRRWPFADV